MTFICEPHTAGRLGAAALCTSLKASPSYWSPCSFCLIWPQLLLGLDYSLTVYLPMKVWVLRRVSGQYVPIQYEGKGNEPLGNHSVSTKPESLQKWVVWEEYYVWGMKDKVVSERVCVTYWESTCTPPCGPGSPWLISHYAGSANENNQMFTV